MSFVTSLGYSDYIPDQQTNIKRDTLGETAWEKARDKLLELLECDKTPLKSGYLGVDSYYYSKSKNLLVKIDNSARRRVPMTSEEVANISKLNNLSGALF
jgi:hypothetical protein